MKSYQTSSSILAKDIAGDKILFRVQQEALQNDAVFVLNEAGAEMWEKLAQPCTIGQLAECLIEKYGITNEQALVDSEAFINKCIQSDMIDVIG